MTAPNLAATIQITAKTTLYAATTSLSSALSNSANSNQVFKVAVIRAVNKGSLGSLTCDLTIFRNSAHSYLVKGVIIEQGASYIALQKDEFVYLEEGDAVYASASSNSAIDVIITYEVWSS